MQQVEFSGRCPVCSLPMAKDNKFCCIQCYEKDKTNRFAAITSAKILTDKERYEQDMNS
jgi:predicted nucleic acid-binding Zn ribbon protein